MSHKTRGKKITGRAPGYWGNAPHARIAAESVVDKVTKWNFDKIVAMGLPFAMWREASSIYNSLPDCSCVKTTSKQADVPCLSCYGTGKTPGYIKFGTQNYWVASTDNVWTLNNVELDKNNRPFRLQLASGALSGFAVSQVIEVNVARISGLWESKFEGFTRDGGANSSINVEYQKDGELDWIPLYSINSLSPTTSVRFKVTFNRGSPEVKSPMFEIVRVRFPTITDPRCELCEPVIRVLTTWDRTAEYRTTYGDRVDTSGKRFWTMPLTYFDESLALNGHLARLSDDVIVEVRYGGNMGTRFALLEFDYSDTFGKFTRQEFAMRQFSGEPGQKSGEFAYRIF